MTNSEMLLGVAGLWALFMMPIGIHRRTVLLLALTGVSLLLGLDLGLEAAGKRLTDPSDSGEPHLQHF